jgi:hypothetical protein
MLLLQEISQNDIFFLNFENYITDVCPCSDTPLLFLLVVPWHRHATIIYVTSSVGYHWHHIRYMQLLHQ